MQRGMQGQALKGSRYCVVDGVGGAAGDRPRLSVGVHSDSEGPEAGDARSVCENRPVSPPAL